MTKGIIWILIWGGSWPTKSYIFPYKVVAGGDETYFLCAVVAAGECSGRNGLFLYILHEWLYLHMCFYSFLEFVIVDRIGMAV